MRSSLKKLDDMGVITLDCTAAKLSGAETISGLMEMCRTWQERKPDDYAHDNPFSQVLALQEIVEKALESPVSSPARDMPTPATTVLKTVAEPARPTHEIIQLHAELAAQRREHQLLQEKVLQQEAALADLRKMVNEIQEQMTSAKRESVPATPANSRFAGAAISIPSAIEKVEKRLAEPEAARPESAAIKGATKPTPEPAAPRSVQEIVESLTQRMEDLRAALIAEKAQLKKDSPSHLKLGQVSIMLTGSETHAFMSPSSQADELICRGVAARFLVLELTRDLKEDRSANLDPVLSVCEAGAAQLQEQSAQLPADQAERVMETARLLIKTLKVLNRT